MPTSPGALERYNELNNAVQGADERGLILALSAFAEESLGHLLESFMLPNLAAKKLLDGFNAPLGTFSARIQAAYALGLITAEQFDNLELMRKIRNEFAHSWKGVSFKNQKIASYIAALHFDRGTTRMPSSPQEKAAAAFKWLILELELVAINLKKRGHGAKLVGHHIIPGFPGTINEQIDEARREFGELQKDITLAAGEHLRFLSIYRERLADRIGLLLSNAPTSRHEELRKMIEALARCPSCLLAFTQSKSKLLIYPNNPRNLGSHLLNCPGSSGASATVTDASAS